jgi:hypothetical protein
MVTSPPLRQRTQEGVKCCGDPRRRFAGAEAQDTPRESLQAIQSVSDLIGRVISARTASRAGTPA